MSYININSYKEWLKENLDAERYEHSLGVAECAEKLAQQYGVDANKAYLAGLVHDCAKCIPTQDLKCMISESGNLCDGEINNPKTYHAPAGVIIAKQKFDIEDEEILDAIRWHTIGKLEMTTFEKIIFIADKIEERTRPAEWTLPIKEALNSDNGLDKALLICYSNTIKSLVDRRLSICVRTIEIYNHLLSKFNKR